MQQPTTTQGKQTKHPRTHLHAELGNRNTPDGLLGMRSSLVRRRQVRRSVDKGADFKKNVPARPRRAHTGVAPWQSPSALSPSRRTGGRPENAKAASL